MGSHGDFFICNSIHSKLNKQNSFYFVKGVVFCMFYIKHNCDYVFKLSL